jgi:tetratricopeptide (TPR) repeat protein
MKTAENFINCIYCGYEVQIDEEICPCCGEKIITLSTNTNELFYKTKILEGKFTEVLGKDSNDNLVLFYKGIAYREQYELDEAIKYFDNLIKQNYNIPAIYREKALVYLYKNQVETAIELVDKSINFDSTSEEAYLYKANILCAVGKSKESLEYIDKALKISPSYLEALWEKAETVTWKLDRLQIDATLNNLIQNLEFRVFDNLYMKNSNNIYANIGKILFNDSLKKNEKQRLLANFMENNPYIYAAIAWLEIRSFDQTLDEIKLALKNIEKAINLDYKNTHFHTCKLLLLRKYYDQCRQFGEFKDMNDDKKFMREVVDYCNIVLSISNTNYYAFNYKGTFLSWLGMKKDSEAVEKEKLKYNIYYRWCAEDMVYLFKDYKKILKNLANCS